MKLNNFFIILYGILIVYIFCYSFLFHFRLSTEMKNIAKLGTEGASELRDIAKKMEVSLNEMVDMGGEKNEDNHDEVKETVIEEEKVT